MNLSELKMKRIFDVIISCFLLLLFSPVLLVICLLIRIDSVGSVFFLQQRVGLYGQPFKIFKFRSMIDNADTLGGFSTEKNDVRITRIGQIIRKTSIDELPQLINVIKGDMSLVGPRPNVFQQRELYSEQEWAQRNSVRPGITGLAQALMRSDATQEVRTQLDLEYVDKHGFFYDLYIMLLTVKQVFLKGGN